MKLLEQVPEDLRARLGDLIRESIDKQVTERVSVEKEKMDAELKDLKKQLADIEKKPASSTSRIGGLTQRPQTAMRGNDSKR